MSEDVDDAVLCASEWSVLPCEHGVAAALVKAHHYSRSASNTSVAAHGLRRLSDGALCGAALWMPPLPPAGRAVVVDGEDWRQVLVLSRLVVLPDVPKNGASFLLGASMRLVDRSRWPILLTYADTRLDHTGAIYRATNWQEHGEVAGGDVWIGPDGEQRGRRRGPKCLTRAQMRSLGFVQAPDMPKIRFVHRRGKQPMKGAV